jgi:uncharacterized protein YcbK (DUF882 family)
VAFGASGVRDAVANGDTRTISMHHVHSDEDITITYKRDGRYDEEALKKLNWFLRDWRRNEPTRMDPHLIDVVWEVWQEVGAKQPISVIGGYRAPATNNMLRRRSKGVARNSQHTVGHAMDFYIPGASLQDMRIVGLRLQRGGVGYYPSSGSPFVHLDTGHVRHWPRMSHDQLARVFPNGRTVHIPSDGKPLPGYELALAEVERRGASPSQNSLNAARDAGIAVDGSSKRNLLASIFRTGDDNEDDATASVSAAPRRSTIVATVEVKSETARQETPRVASIPLPAQRPARPLQVAAIAPPVAPAVPAKTIGTAALGAPTPNSIVAARGAWDEASSLRQIGDPAQLQTASVAGLGGEPKVAGYAALAYAAVEKNIPAKPASSGLKFIRKANASELTPPIAKPATLAVATAPAAIEAKSDDIWLRAVMLAPDLQHYLSATLIGAPDPKELRPLMRKPTNTLAMVFSDDPMAGIVSDHFSGDAVVFLETVSFATRTAALR